MSLAQWAFGDATAHPTADGQHTFYRVEATPQTGLDYHGITVDSRGRMLGPVAGEGATPEAALHEAMRKVTQLEAEHDQQHMAAVRWSYGVRSW